MRSVSYLLHILIASSFAAAAQADAQDVAVRHVAIETADGRTSPVRVFSPAAGCAACPLIVFSHGAFSSPDRYDVLLNAWAGAGYVVAAPLHADSEIHPYQDHYRREDRLPMRLDDFEAAAALDGLDGVALSGDIIAAGHSFGALVAQIAGGARLDGAHKDLHIALETPPLAVIAISPPGPVEDYVSPQGWRRIDAPMLVVTGTADVVPRFAPTWRAHLASYDAAPAGLAYALVYNDMDHYFNGAFGRPGETDDAARAATDHLNDAIIQFADHFRQSADPAPGWDALSRNGLVSARRRHQESARP